MVSFSFKHFITIREQNNEHNKKIKKRSFFSFTLYCERKLSGKKASIRHPTQGKQDVILQENRFFFLVFFCFFVSSSNRM
jgi:hypothetical protein